MIEILYHWKNAFYQQANQVNRKNKFAIAVFDPEHETFVVHVASFDSLSNDQKTNIHSFCRAQIAILVVNEAFISIFIEYSNFANVFSPELALKFSKYTKINFHAIKLVDNQQPPYEPIYNLKPVELEILKTYTETNLANGFIRFFKTLSKNCHLFW